MPPTILIVDDHAAFRRAARALLGADGFEVVGEAAGGHEALAQATILRPEVVLLDIQLPDMDGFEVADRLADRPDPPHVILISSRDARDYGGQVERAASRGFVAKSLLSGHTIRTLLG
ncbi:MAG: response regulator transcription factor [Candidatus Limnocylindrales bacterium]